MIGPLSWIGGKNRLASTIISLLPKHTTYVEPFAGGAQVFFHKDPSKVEVLNDLDGEIVNFFRVVQNHDQELLRYIRYMLVSRQWYALLQATIPASLTDIQRAARFYYLQKNSFGGRVYRQNYALHVAQPPGFGVRSIEQVIQQAHQRLVRVQIEALPYEDILAKYDRPETCFYVDPPYFRRALYKFNLEHKDFEHLATLLGRLKGKFVLSLNDVPEVRQLFAAFHLQPVELAYTAQKHAGNRYKELLITNYQPTARDATSPVPSRSGRFKRGRVLA